jgi:DNA mismatch repair ATPase MutS
VNFVNNLVSIATCERLIETESMVFFVTHFVELAQSFDHIPFVRTFQLQVHVNFLQCLDSGGFVWRYEISVPD